MSKKKDKMPAISDQPKAKREQRRETRQASSPSKREGTGKMFYLDDELEAALQEFMASMTPLEPTQTQVFSEGLRMFLASKGFWPRKKQP